MTDPPPFENEKQTTNSYHGARIYTLPNPGRYLDKQTTKLHFRYVSHVAFRYKTDCDTRIELVTNSASWLHIYCWFLVGRDYCSLKTRTCEPWPFLIRFLIITNNNIPIIFDLGFVQDGSITQQFSKFRHRLFPTMSSNITTVKALRVFIQM